MGFGQLVEGTSALKPVYSEPKLHLAKASDAMVLRRDDFVSDKSDVECALDDLAGSPFCSSRSERVASALIWTVGIAALFLFSFVIVL